jgi:putative nucleotidyltransferase with HDIG domain
VTEVRREAVLALVEGGVQNEHLRHHMLATEAIMRGLASRLGEDPEEWGLAGLGHDLDAEDTEGAFERHGAEAAATLAAAGVPPAAVHAVAAHNPATGVAAETACDIALLAADQLSGLITAAALVRPDRDLGGVKVKSVRKRYREGAFARGVDRAAIARVGELGLELEEAMAIGLEAMQGIASDLGLGGQGAATADAGPANGEGLATGDEERGC